LGPVERAYPILKRRFSAYHASPTSAEWAALTAWLLVANSKDALAQEYKAKADLLSADLASLRAENAEYRAWLEKSTDAVPIMVPQLLKLRERVAQLEKSPDLAGAASTTTTAAGVFGAAPNDPNVTVRVGSSYIDSITGTVFGVKHVSVENTADVQITMPGKAAIDEIANPGTRWSFQFKGKPYAVTLREISFITDTVQIQITQAP
jgi:hypothetical protein